jgi:hypothetical protein
VKSVIATVLLLALIALHQDFWNWTDKTLVFGFLPVGLAYHAGYSLAAAAAMALLVRFFWPAHLEDEEELTRTTPAHGEEAAG